PAEPPPAEPPPAEPPPAEPPPTSERPGWGKGDPNHVHTGPPGQAKTPPGQEKKTK
ncbi:MAG: hypothetical protein K0T00_1861, partial [Gaiellaceae bacterium]|nr:hypothetical protein [Gaiellaceae bacterium]